MPHLSFVQALLQPEQDALVQSAFLQAAALVAAHALPVQFLLHLRLSPA